MNFGPPIEQPEGITFDPDYECPICSAIVMNRDAHAAWHDALDATAAQARRSAIFTNVLGGP